MYHASMRKFFLQYWLLFAIIVLGGILRFYDLDKNPPALDVDFAAYGYDAYSILKTGADQYGQPFPLVFRSLDSYPLALAVYSLLPSIALFGLTEFAVRLPAVIFGVLLLPVTYWFIFLLTHQRKLALLATLFLILSPWHIQYSREVSNHVFVPLLTTTSLALFLLSLRRPPLLLPAVFLNILPIYAYHGAIISPLIFSVFAFLYRKKIKMTKWISLSLITAVLAFIPLVFLIFQGNATVRYNATTIFNPEVTLSDHIQWADDDLHSQPFTSLIHNRRIVYVKAWLQNYLVHWKFDYLFFDGISNRNFRIPDVGLLYLWDLPFLLLGLVLLLKTWKQTRSKFLLGWFLIAPIPSSLALGAPASLRLILWMPLLQIIVAMGTLRFWAWSPSQRFCRLFQRIVVIFFFLNFIYVIHQLFVHTPVHSAEIWNYSQKIAVQKLRSIEDRYDRIIFTRRYKQPYIYYLFYNQIDPTWYQANWKPGEIFRGVRVFDKFEFRNIRWEEDKLLKNTLLIGSLKDFPEDVSPIYDIHSLDDIVTLRFVEVNINTSDVSLRE